MNNYIWADSWKAQKRARALQDISGIVHQYHGTVEVDMESMTLTIEVPEEYKVECTLKVQEAMEKMGCLET